MVNEEKKVPASAKAGAVKKTDVRPGFFQRVKKWLRDMKSELKKVVWPTSEQTVKNTSVALTFMVVSAILLWGFDTLASAGIRAILMLVS